jgi:hypothetical protein
MKDRIDRTEIHVKCKTEKSRQIPSCVIRAILKMDNGASSYLALTKTALIPFRLLIDRDYS